MSIPGKGSIIVADGTGKVKAVTPGNSNQVLRIDPNEPLGVRWDVATQNYYFSALGPDTNLTIGAGFTAIPLTTITKNDPIFTHITNSSEINIMQDGDYLVSIDFTGEVNSNKKYGFMVRLTRDTGDGFSEVGGTRAVCYANNGKNTCSATTVVSLLSGDSIRVEAQKISGTSSVFALINATKITIQSL